MESRTRPNRRRNTPLPRDLPIERLRELLNPRGIRMLIFQAWANAQGKPMNTSSFSHP
jgi:hypothetical protein